MSGIIMNLHIIADTRRDVNTKIKLNFKIKI